MERSKLILTTIAAVLGFVVLIIFVNIITPDNTQNNALLTESTISETILESTTVPPVTVTISLEDVIDDFHTVEATSAAETENTVADSCEKETESKEVVTETETETETEDIPETDTEESTSPETETETERNMTYLGEYKITGYSTKSCCNGSGNAGKTASGEPLTPWYSVAMKGIPFGTKIYIDGLGEFVVHDRGVGKGKVDVCVNSCGHMKGGSSEAYQITGRYDVYIIE